ncbi:hypothetical protein JHD47_07805 [Sulfurimonas sp. SAG-AH-194-L11]|nr:hypothetical protein [Sulfurimonas sp. SAG-AH-194-L11]MDF1877718.1 hypothetical protein [Sulfurimonas sp. SAG-AH-194-L11]
MSKLNLTALLLGAALFTGLGAVSLSAEDMKCGAGKCGGSDAKSEKAAQKCGAGKCGDSAKKCGDGKKKSKKEATKCGAGKTTGKCGSK